MDRVKQSRMPKIGTKDYDRLDKRALTRGQRSFSDGEAVDSIETEKSRLILHELEPGWWILASIDLTRLIKSHSDASSPSGFQSDVNVEYSAREVSPPALMLRQILRAHRIFLLHHGSSLADLYGRTARTKFCSVLKRFWNGFVSDWDVLLNGNPAVAIFNGLKLAAGGELGVGVGEEEWGSGEREVLEDFVGRTEGLVDLLVSRFGDAPVPEHLVKGNPNAGHSPNANIPMDQTFNRPAPRPSDGVIFSGLGAITRPSVKTISHWAESISVYGHDAYGVRDNPTSTRRRKRRRGSSNMDSGQKSSQDQHLSIKSTVGDGDFPIGVPPPLVGGRTFPSQLVNGKQSLEDDGKNSHERILPEKTVEGDETGTETMMKYLTLGVYGSKWGIPFKKRPMSRQISTLREEAKAGSSVTRSSSSDTSISGYHERMPGSFLVGYRGELEAEYEDDDAETETGTELEDREGVRTQEHRIMIRTLHVDRKTPQTLAVSDRPIDENNPSLNESYPDRLRVVVYLRQPFMFIFLFELHADSLRIPAFYRSLHHQLGPLQRPLLTSTSPEKVSERLAEASLPRSTASTKSAQPICDLVYDPMRLTVHTTIPNIPEPGAATPEALKVGEGGWSRVEALSVHSQILNTFTSTRRAKSELERTSKINRGWWVVWMRLPHATDPKNVDLYREAFLIRKASDYTPSNARKTSAMFGRDVSESTTGAGWGPGKLAEGIGIDARQYIEGLLSLNR
ncbi:MAG: hypothetical protein Q9191_006167 [Dirinaria sp. TL-2023a]